MRQLLPEPADHVDAFTAYGAIRSRPSSLRTSMVASIDGSIVDETGWTSRLGGPADKRLLQILRALSDGIVVGASTIRTGRCPPHRLSSELADRRAAIGHRGPAPIIVITRSAEFDWSLPVFTSAVTKTIVVTSEESVSQLKAEGPPVDLLGAGERVVDLDRAISELRRRRGLQHLVCEGGPRTISAMLDRNLVDEVCLNLSPVLLPAGHSHVADGLLGRVELTPLALYEEDGVLFTRYGVRVRDDEER